MKITFVLIGAGNRGQGIFGQYALDNPHRAKFRTAFTLLRQGVKEFATANVKDFEDLGFAHVWNPLLSV